ncbi:hypothetical protein MRX96_008125 [Rhipicephalus microplus]
MTCLVLGGHAPRLRGEHVAVSATLGGLSTKARAHRGALRNGRAEGPRWTWTNGPAQLKEHHLRWCGGVLEGQGGVLLTAHARHDWHGQGNVWHDVSGLQVHVNHVHNANTDVIHEELAFHVDGSDLLDFQKF